MYQKVLVPLDGSPLAECALPEVKHLAKGGFVGEVFLVNVVETYSVALAESIDASALHAAHRDAAQDYLERIMKQLSSEGIRTKMELLEGSPSQAIVSYAKENKVDLIVIATHGHTGMARLMFGSVALRVLHDAHTPVLLIRPEECR
ncbi:MAG: universal stress protein [Syntrophales bacterium]|jgi:nucleotide-binding universal stress UspA family protein|nr:universal stress protein [Syntrophales bacterium]